MLLHSEPLHGLCQMITSEGGAGGSLFFLSARGAEWYCIQVVRCHQGQVAQEPSLARTLAAARGTPCTPRHGPDGGPTSGASCWPPGQPLVATVGPGFFRLNQTMIASPPRIFPGNAARK